MFKGGKNVQFLLLQSWVVVMLLATSSNAFGELSIAGAEQQFYYVNNVKHRGWTHVSYELACIEPGGCPNISVVSQRLLRTCGDCRNITESLGCYESQPDASRYFKTMQALNFSEHTSIPALDMNEGTMVCSSGQLSAFVTVQIQEGASGGSGPNAFDLASWHSTGRRFAKAVSRTEDDCHIYALQATRVRITTFDDISSIASVAYVPIQPFRLTSFKSIHANKRASTFLSENGVHISCSTSEGTDFLQLTPVDSVVYGADSTVLSAISVRCDSLEIAPVSNLSCRSSIETQVPAVISAYANGLAADVEAGFVKFYRGPGVKCLSSDRNVCLSMDTYADGDGGEATVALPAKRHARIFVFPIESQNIALIAEGPGVCVIRHSSWAFVQHVGINGVVGDVFKGYFDHAILAAGAVLECNQKCMVIAQTRALLKDFNLHGYIEDFVVAAPGPATSFPTASPVSSSPTASPTNASLAKFPTIGPKVGDDNNNEDDLSLIILSSSLAALGSLVILGWKYDARSFIFGRVDQRADASGQYGSYVAREEVPVALRTVRNEDSTRSLPVAELFT